MEPRQLRDKANEALTKGRFARAAELFEEYCQLDPKDHQARVRLGDAWVKVGDNARAITAYQAAAEGFAREGFLPRAIAASKLILELEPSHQGVQQMLAGLYARRGGTGGGARAVTPAPVTPPPTGPAEPPAPTTRAALFIELPPELDEALARDEATDVELELSDAEKGRTEAAPSQPTMAKAAPPGLRRRSSDAQPPEPAPQPQPQPLRVAEMPATSPVDVQPPVPGNSPFTELVVQADSLLHAVELAALAADGAGKAVEEETVSEAPSQDDGLPKIPLFSDLPRDAFIALFERCPLRRFPEGTRIIEQGTRGDAFYVICAGRVRIERRSGSELRSLAVLGEGAFFGEMALLSGAPRSASVVSASEETQVLEISAPVLAALSRRFPQVARALRRFCRQRLLSDVVNTSALFQPFGRKDRRELVERFRAREVRRGDVIIHEGHQVDGLYVVLSGEVAVSKGGQSLARLREGELFGEMSLLQKTPANATVTAARNTSLLRLPREDFDTLILTHPQILILVSELTEARQRSNEALLGGHTNVAGETEEPHEELLLF
ncbi:cyclic nucleotide-binding domain-containing protein [Archangium violaceum]|uniref:cyclic nucleotide-binding domain-containing protein n=1 Tax=Archangium violaceum TaxID=83451 RepID=UPI00193B7232|nr:cyclic nucleotide-binding domain-containing protein [Archangium violaceum]QRK06591.1 cyclic nucleotide-binding domain-containing protein [Archangium violaceum]